MLISSILGPPIFAYNAGASLHIEAILKPKIDGTWFISTTALKLKHSCRVEGKVTLKKLS